ncbi:GMC oxidoreductase [Diaporthe helianthi]|uniref:GMC oxidoreductase n=1 Tax=Diaporthe helianthi TaxID=158607 RepID=A0A2P5HIK5_DIAHE|nr:GMC oxidoreductase [Diaporthe helianthi]
MAAQQNEYDFVIVGGGTAGLVVAARLTENPKVSVLVLEAGGNALQDPRIAVPAMWSSILGTDFDWDFLTTPQENLNGRQIGQPQGRLLGGSSGLNAEVFVPPSGADFDKWEAMGNEGWGWKEVGPFFRKFFTLAQPEDKLREHVGITWIDDTATGAGGPIKASFTDSHENPLSKAWVEAFKKLGGDLTADPFSGRSTGAFSCPASVDPETKTRSYSASGYYAPAAQRPNLEVVTGANVNKIVLESSGAGSSTTARAVAFTGKDGVEHQVKARRDVILAAGVFQTPKLLELSGIGNKILLQKLGIDCKVDNPGVGENLQDHMMTGVSFEVADGIMTGDCLVRQEPGIAETFMKMYQEHKAGPLAGAALTSYAFTPLLGDTIDKIEAGAQESLKQAVKGLQTDGDLKSASQRATAEYVTELMQKGSESTGAFFALPVQVNLHNGPKQIGMTTNPVDGNYMSIGAAIIHPLSRGSSHIVSADVATPPTIDPRYMSHPFDIEVYARHLMTVEALAQTEPLASVLKPNGRRAQPGPNGAKVDTVERAKEYIRATAISNNHPVGTCCMAPRDKGGVVDAQLKVYGVEGLRVVDSSIMPLITQANTQTTVYAVAEKAADILKRSYGI